MEYYPKLICYSFKNHIKITFSNDKSLLKIEKITKLCEIVQMLKRLHERTPKTCEHLCSLCFCVPFFIFYALSFDGFCSIAMFLGLTYYKQPLEKRRTLSRNRNNDILQIYRALNWFTDVISLDVPNSAIPARRFISSRVVCIRNNTHCLCEMINSQLFSIFQFSIVFYGPYFPWLCFL